MRSNAKRSYQSGGYVQGDPYGGPGPDDVAPMPIPQQHQQPNIRIAPPPMSQNAQRVMAQLMSQKTPNWGSALSKLANVAITAHNEKKRGAARQAAETTKREQRARWANELGAGASPRDLAMSDPDFLADAEFQKSWAGTAPEQGFEPVMDEGGNIIGQRGPDGRVYEDPRTQGPAPEIFEDVASPYGFGGHAQRSSTTGKLSGYQSAPTQGREPARPTAKDQHGRLRYLDTGEAAFSDDILGQGQAPEAPLKDRLKMVRDLSDDWRETVKPMQGLIDQSNRMDIGFEQARKGDMLSGSQAILISFNKLLDPSSVVRESEYARSATGQSALETMHGFVEKLGKGGAGVTLSELESYRRFGQEVVKSALESTLRPERARITRLVEFAGVDPELIFTGRFASDAAPQQAPQGQPQAAPQEAVPPMAQGQLPTAPQLPEAFQATSGPAASDQGPQADPARIAHYAALQSAELERQIETMAANPTIYSQQEKDAVKVAKRAQDISANPQAFTAAQRTEAATAWERAFGGR